MTSAQDRKRLRPCSGSDTSVDGDLSYLDLDTGGVIKLKSTSTPQTKPSDITLSKKSYDALMTKLMTMEKCLTKLDKLDKLDQIESAVRQMDKRMSAVESRLDKTEAVVVGVEKGVKFVSDKYDQFQVERNTDRMKANSLDKSVTSLKSDTAELKKALSEVQKLNIELKEEVLDLKSRSMRDNLVYTNVPERHEEDTEAVLTEFLESKLNISNICFERVHRIKLKNPNGRGGPKVRPIVAKFTFFKDRERVRKSGKMLKGTNYGIQEQFPYEIEERRKPLYPLLRSARRNRQKATLVKDKLYVDGKEVSVPPDRTAGAERTATSGGASASLTAIPMETTHP